MLSHRTKSHMNFLEVCVHQKLLNNKLYFIVTKITSIYTSNDKASALKATYSDSLTQNM